MSPHKLKLIGGSGVSSTAETRSEGADPLDFDLPLQNRGAMSADHRDPSPVCVKGLNQVFPTEDGSYATVLDDIDLTVADGEFVALVGPSGCGKTTLLNIMAGLEPHYGAGSITVNGHAPRAGNADVGYMLARDCLVPWRRALRNASLALEIHKMDKEKREGLARDALNALGLEGYERSFPAQLSQGMRQRVALARVFAAQPRLVLLDEPFSALDAQTRLTVQDAFLRVWEGQGTTVVLVTHDLGEAVALADRVFIMSRRPGRIKAIQEIDLPRPRRASETRAHHRYHQLYEATWNELKDEVLDDESLTRDRAVGGAN